MNKLLVAWTNLNGFHPAGTINGNGKDKIPIHIGAVRRQNKWLCCFKHQIRTSALPPFNKFRLWRQIRGISLGSTLLNPFLYSRDLFVGKARLVREFERLGVGQPWWHKSCSGHDFDLASMLLDVLVSQKREGARFSRMVATGARVKDNRSNIAIKGD